MPDIDLFASRLNAKLDQFVSWHPEPGALAIDAFSISWSNQKFYAFPPFSLLTRVLAKIRNDVALVLLIAPTWSTQPWYPMLLQLAIARPVLFHYVDHLLTLPHSNQVHPMLYSLHLAGWTLSGNPSLQRDFLMKQSESSMHLGLQGQTSNTIQFWKRWCGWCKERQADIIQASINDVVNFLADCFANGRSYSAINTYRSALSSTFCNINNVAVGSHPLVTRLLKGVYNLRTPSPRYSSTWDVTKVTG